MTTAITKTLQIRKITLECLAKTGRKQQLQQVTLNSLELIIIKPATALCNQNI